MFNYEKPVMLFFNLGVIAGLGSIGYGILKNSSPAELTPNITAAFLMSICGNCTRILANSEAFGSEKISISMAVVSYSLALTCDWEEHPVLAVYLKLITTGCVGLWNALQMIRLTYENTAAKAALACYSLGAALGFSALIIGLSVDVPPKLLAPFITLTFIMSHIGNLVRSEFNHQAQMLERRYILAAVLSYCIALYYDFSSKNGTTNVAAYTKLTAAGFIGLWNTAQTWRLNPATYDVQRSICTHIHAFFMANHRIAPVNTTEDEQQELRTIHTLG